MPAGAVGTTWAAGVWTDTCWEALTWADALALQFVLDVNTRVLRYLRHHYSAPTGDLNALTLRYLNAQTGEMNARWHKLVTDATAAMT